MLEQTTMERFSKDLSNLCAQYGVMISGRSTNGSLFIHPADTDNVECNLVSVGDTSANVYCSCK
jgi:hypothetical protein